MSATTDARPAGRSWVRARRAGWLTASQAFDSISNLFLTVWVARAVSASDFGRFGVVYAVLLLLLQVGRVLATNPLLINYSASRERYSSRIAASAMGVGVSYGALAGVVLAVVGLVVGGTSGTVALAAAVMLPGLVLQDNLAFVFLSRDKPHLGFVNNAVWATAQLATFVVATSVFHTHSPAVLLGLWGLSAYLADAVSVAQLRVLPDVRLAFGWVRRFRSQIQDQSFETLVGQTGQQGITWVVGAGVDLVGVGAVRAAQLPFGVMRVFSQGLSPFGLAEGVRLYKRRPRGLVTLIRLWSAGGFVLTVAVGVALYVMPVSWGRHLLSVNWAHAHPIILAMAVSAAGSQSVVPCLTGLRAMRQTRVSAKLRVPLSGVQIVGVAVGVGVGGLRGAADGLAVGSVVAVLLAQLVFERTWRRLQSGAIVPVTTDEQLDSLSVADAWADMAVLGPALLIPARVLRDAPAEEELASVGSAGAAPPDATEAPGAARESEPAAARPATRAGLLSGLGAAAPASDRSSGPGDARRSGAGARGPGERTDPGAGTRVGRDGGAGAGAGGGVGGGERRDRRDAREREPRRSESAEFDLAGGWFERAFERHADQTADRSADHSSDQSTDQGTEPGATAEDRGDESA